MPEHDPSQPPPLPPGDPYRSPSSNAPSPADSPHEGSVGLGILISIALLLFGGPITGIVTSMLGGLLSYAGVNLYAFLMLPIGLIPLLLVIGAGIWFARKGQRKTAKGIWLGLAITIGLVLLLVAACFGILAGTNFH